MFIIMHTMPVNVSSQKPLKRPPGVLAVATAPRLFAPSDCSLRAAA